MWRSHWLSTVCFAAPDTPPGDDELAKLKVELAAAKARITELNNEAAGHRLNAKNEKTRADELAGKLETAQTETAAKLAEAEGRVTEASGKAKSATLDAALKLAAKDAGIRDLDGLKLLDISKVVVGDDGVVTIPPKFFEDAKTAKPWLFGQASTSNPATPPPADKPATKLATAMTPEEYRAARAALR